MQNNTIEKHDYKNKKKHDLTDLFKVELYQVLKILFFKRTTKTYILS